jgi:hypothetical protein
MKLIFPIEPYPDESLAGLIVRATARNHHRNPLKALRTVDVVTTAPGSLCSRSPDLAKSIARLVGSNDKKVIASMFHPAIEGRPGWFDFFGEPVRNLYRNADVRSVAPGALAKRDYVRAMWGLRPFSFDPTSKEQLIDACPQCARPLGWTLTYGVSFCDHCSRPEKFMHFTWHYPGLDLRDFPQPKVKVDDEEALDFVTGLIDPYPGRKEASRRLLPDMWAGLPNGEIFELVMTFASMLNASEWDKKSLVRRRAKSGEGWERTTPEVLSIAGRAVIGGQAGFEEFGDILRRKNEDTPRERKYGKTSEIGPLGIVDPNLCKAAKVVLKEATDAYLTARKNTDMMPLLHLSERYGVSRVNLRVLAESGLILTTRVEGLMKGPVLMSDAALAPLVRQARESISGTLAAPQIGIHRMYLGELERLGLLERVEGPVLKLLESAAYYTKASIEALRTKLAEKLVHHSSEKGARLKVALRSLKVSHVPWVAILVAVLEGRLAASSLKLSGSLGDRLVIDDLKALAEIVRKGAVPEPAPASEWVGTDTAAEILGTNEVAIYRLSKIGKLKRHDPSPMYCPFKRTEIERLAREVIFVPEIVQAGQFGTYREASSWLRTHNLDSLLELKQGSWKLYARAPVELALKKRMETWKPRAPVDWQRPRPKGLLHGPDSSQGKLAAAQEDSDPSRVGLATAASILGTTIFAVQQLAAIKKLAKKGRVTPFCRSNVERLAQQMIFIPEIMRRAGLVSHRGVIAWLLKNDVKPMLCLKSGGRVPVFDRARLEMIFGRPISIGNAYPREVKAKLLEMVSDGSKIHPASKMLDVNYATAKMWVKESRARAT